MREDLMAPAAGHSIALSAQPPSYIHSGVEPLSDSELGAVTGGSDRRGTTLKDR